MLFGQWPRVASPMCIVSLGLELELGLYPLLPQYPSYPTGPRYNPLIFGYKVTNITFLGGGKIDGQGSYWWHAFKNGSLKYERHRLLEMMYCNDLKIENLKFFNSPYWTIHPIYCDNIDIRNVIIYSPSDSPNTDGIDPDSSKNIYGRNITIDVGDDCIAIKSGKDYLGRVFNRSSENILFENCTFLHGHGVSIGSEMSGGVRNVTIRNSYLNMTDTGCRMKSTRGRGGYVQHVLYQNLTIENINKNVLTVDMFYDTTPPTNKSATPIFDDIVMENIKASKNNKQAGLFRCLPESPCKGIKLRNISISANKGFQCSDVSGTAENVNPKWCGDIDNN